MMVLFVSQSEKKAIQTTQRVLDAFANRIGENTWQTVITQEGLTTVKQLLKQSATKSTAVSCLWVRSRTICELLWIVGRKNSFDADGMVPVNTTKRQVLQKYRETGWSFMPVIQALTAVASLLHDIGKASSFFQTKLRTESFLADPFRHELVSAILIKGMFCYYASQGEDLFSALASGALPPISDILPYCRNSDELQEQYKPFKGLSSNLLLSILWLVLSHHRLPLPVNSHGDSVTRSDFPISADSLQKLFDYVTTGFTYRRGANGDTSKQDLFDKELQRCFTFTENYSAFSLNWHKDLKKWCGRLVSLSPMVDVFCQNGTLRTILKYARISLMLGDHFYSSQGIDQTWRTSSSLYANTDKNTGELKQKLDEHLFGVKSISLKVAHYLPYIESELPRTGVIKELKRKSVGRFAWQDRAVTTIKNFLTEHSQPLGCFVLNLAGTGCGKTTGNAKVASAIGKDDGSLRFSLVLGLRTLTLQTGDEYRERMKLTDEELAVVIGSTAVQYLHQHEMHRDKHLSSEITENEQKAVRDDSESSEELIDAYTNFEGELPHEGFATLLDKSNAAKMLFAPVLCCTIDQMMAATECCRGGRYMLPFLRLMSSDLIIDEVDDFTGDDLRAIGRLIYLCGSLGRKVILSSATLPPEIAKGYFYAYQAGYKTYADLQETPAEIMCAWLDENECKTELFRINGTNQKTFSQFHDEFTKKQISRLQNASLIKLGNVFETPIHESCYKASSFPENYFIHLAQAALKLHAYNHLTDSKTGKEISFGVIRMANIDPCVAVAKFLCRFSLSSDTEFRVMVYHSRQTLLMRHEQEHYLDSIFKRKGESADAPEILQDEQVRRHIDSSEAKKILFVVVCTPVEEVGRDHDYDWAVIEPSSWRSIVQMAGRVNRHRQISVRFPNVTVMQYNFRTFCARDKSDKNGNPCCFYNRPGYETEKPMCSHDLKVLLPSWTGVIDASARLVYDKQGNNEMAKYEHEIMERQLLNKRDRSPDAIFEYSCRYWDLSAIPQFLSPFRNSPPSIELVLKRTGDDENEVAFYEHDSFKNWAKVDKIYKITNVRSFDQATFGSNLWLDRDYMMSVERFAAKSGIDSEKVMDRFGGITFPANGSLKNWLYSDAFGLYRNIVEGNEND